MATTVEKKPGASSAASAAADAGAAGTPGKSTLTGQLGGGATYTVQAGENLQSIAKKLGTTVEALKAANTDRLKSFPTKSGGVVQGFNAGQVINIPGGAATAGDGATGAAPAAATPAATPPAAAAAKEEGGSWLDSLMGMLHDVGDFLTGSNGAPPAAVDEHPVAAPSGGATAGGKPAAGKAADGATGGTTGGGGGTGTAPLADLTDKERGEKLSTFHTDELGKLDKFGMSATGREGAKSRNQWLTAAEVKATGKLKGGKMASGQEFIDQVDALNDKKDFSEEQDKILDSAREFAANPKELTPEQQKKGTIDWGKAVLSLDGVSLNDDLKQRLIKFVRFLGWAGLVTGPTTIGSVMRSPAAAHKLSVAWMFNLTTNNKEGSTLTFASNRQKLVENVTARGGTDADGNKWLSDATVEGLKSKKDDDAALFEYIKTTAAPEANKIQVQGALAAEGYKEPEKRHPNVAAGSFVSNHLIGEAVDMFPPWVFNNLFDPLIDAIAMYFGLWRAVKDSNSSPEHWHYERLGMPPGAEDH